MRVTAGAFVFVFVCGGAVNGANGRVGVGVGAAAVEGVAVTAAAAAAGGGVGVDGAGIKR